MEIGSVTKMTRWPFYLGDALLLGFAGLSIYRSAWPLSPLAVLICGCAVLAGAILGLLPAYLEYQSAVKRTQILDLAGPVEQIQNLEQIGQQVAHATALWNTAHEAAEKANSTAQKILAAQDAKFKEFHGIAQTIGEREKVQLKFELDKARRSEGDWLQTMVGLLDHVNALYQAALRSGQGNLIQQIGSFQTACRDLVRRVGLAAIGAKPDDLFDPKLHHAQNASGPALEKAVIDQVLAPGYTFQGQFLRPVMVTVKAPQSIVTEPETQRTTGLAAEPVAQNVVTEDAAESHSSATAQDEQPPRDPSPEQELF